MSADKNTSEELPSIRVSRDGDSYMASWGDFTNIQESPCAFGDTPAEAIMNFLKEENLLICCF